jgi:hypothetical protein
MVGVGRHIRRPRAREAMSTLREMLAIGHDCQHRLPATPSCTHTRTPGKLTYFRLSPSPDRALTVRSARPITH